MSGRINMFGKSASGHLVKSHPYVSEKTLVVSWSSASLPVATISCLSDSLLVEDRFSPDETFKSFGRSGLINLDL